MGRSEEPEPVATAGATQPLGHDAMRSLGRTWWMTGALLGLILAWAHNRPTATYPLEGLSLLAGLWLLAVLALLVGRRTGLSARSAPVRAAALPGAALALFTAWAWWSTARSPAAAEGAVYVGTLAQGLVLFWVGVFIVAGHARVHAGDPARSNGGARIVCAFFALLAAAFAVHAILQYHLLYPVQLRRYETSGAYDPDDIISKGVAYALRIRRVGSRFGNANVLAGFLAMCVPMVVAAGWSVSGRLRKPAIAAAAFALAAIIAATWRTDSAGGMLVLIAALAIVGWLLVQHRPVPPAAALLVAAMLATATFGAPPLRADPNTGPDVEHLDAAAADPNLTGVRQFRTALQRVYYWRAGLSIWREAPLAGQGLGGYARVYGRHRIEGASETRYAHNFVVHLAAETGLIGLALFAAFVGFAAAKVFRGERAPGGHAALPRFALAAAAALFLLDSLGEITFSIREVYGDFCLLAGAAVAASAASRTDSPPRPLSPWPSRLSLIAAAAVAAGAWFVILPDQMARHWGFVMSDSSAAMEAARREGDRAEARQYAVDAWRAASRAVAWQPRNAERLQDRAWALAALDRHREAAMILEKACEMDADSASLRGQLAEARRQLGEREKALATVDEAIRLHPLNARYRLQKSRYLEEDGRPEEALQTARDAARIAFEPMRKEEAAARVEELEGRIEQ